MLSGPGREDQKLAAAMGCCCVSIPLAALYLGCKKLASCCKKGSAAAPRDPSSYEKNHNHGERPLSVLRDPIPARTV